VQYVLYLILWQIQIVVTVNQVCHKTGWL